MRILLLSRYGSLGPSSRIRFYQYLPFLRDNGIDVTVVPLLGNDYLMTLYAGRRSNLKNILKAYLERIGCLLKQYRFDLLWIEYEMFPWLPAVVEKLFSRMDVPYVVDYDDALFHRYDMHSSVIVRWLLGKKIDNIMRRAALVVAGNKYLMDRAWLAGSRKVEYLPTVVDLRRYHTAPRSRREAFTVGWIGSPLTAKYLHFIRPALVEVCNGKDTRLVLVGSGDIEFAETHVEIRAWSEETEVADIQSFDVGIMPLPDEPWTRGKCGYKVIQYMACGKPVIASPVGVNHQMVEHGINGFLVENSAEWVNAIKTFRSSQELRERMGKAGRRKVENEYCLQVTESRLLSFLLSAAG